MAKPRPLRRDYTLGDYWAIEDASPQKHEYYAGDILVMAGGTPRHNELTVTVGALLHAALRGGPCRVLSSDQRILTPDGLYTYADVSVYCGGVQLSPDARPCAVNPAVIVEVLSPSTRAYDRGDKREMYLAIPSLGDLLLVEPDEPLVEHWRRAGDRFELRVLRGPEAVIELAACVARLRLGDLYVEGG